MEQSDYSFAFHSRPKYLDVTTDEAHTDPTAVLSKLYYNRSLTHEFLDDKKSALFDATQSLAFQPKNPVFIFHRANINLSLRNFRTAFTDLMEVARITGRPNLVRKKIEIARSASVQQVLLDSLKNQTNLQTAARMQQQKSYPKLNMTVSDLELDFDNFTEKDAIALIGELKEQKMIKEEYVTKMISKIRELHENLPNIVEIERPKTGCVIKVVGDTHGQFQDLIYIFESFGNPSSENPYLFNGDYVDRGSQGLEILLTLFAWKIANPNSIYFNRGNQYVLYIYILIYIFNIILLI